MSTSSRRKCCRVDLKATQATVDTERVVLADTGGSLSGHVESAPPRDRQPQATLAVLTSALTMLAAGVGVAVVAFVLYNLVGDDPSLGPVPSDQKLVLGFAYWRAAGFLVPVAVLTTVVAAGAAGIFRHRRLARTPDAD
jgi:hypothetical protein